MEKPLNSPLRTEEQLRFIWDNLDKTAKETSELHNKRFPNLSQLDSEGKQVGALRWRLRKDPRFNTGIASPRSGTSSTAGGAPGSRASGTQDTPTQQVGGSTTKRRSLAGNTSDEDYQPEHKTTPESPGVRAPSARNFRSKRGRKNPKVGDDETSDPPRHRAKRSRKVLSEDDDDEEEESGLASSQPAPPLRQPRGLAPRHDGHGYGVPEPERGLSASRPSPAFLPTPEETDMAQVVSYNSPASQQTSATPTQTAIHHGQQPLASRDPLQPMPAVPGPAPEGYPFDLMEYNGKLYNRGVHPGCTIDGPHRHRGNGEVAFPSVAAVENMFVRASGVVSPMDVNPFGTLLYGRDQTG